MSKEKKVTRREFLWESGGVTATAVMLVNASKNATVAEIKLPHYAMLINIDRCKGCMACAVACKGEFDVPLGVFRSQIITYEKGKFPNVKRLFLPWLCNHCENPVCLAGCPVDPKEEIYIAPDGREIRYQKTATYQTPDGIVNIDNGMPGAKEDRCIGCGVCVKNCPYKARFLILTNNGPRAHKCTLCVHRLDKGDKPACVKACPHRARMVGDLNDSQSEISRTLVEYKAKNKEVATLPSLRYGADDRNTEPRCFYVGLSEEEIVEVYKEGGCVRDERDKARK